MNKPHPTFEAWSEEHPGAVLLGHDAKGYGYYRTADGYVYQRFPTDREQWFNGADRQGKMNGWICTAGVWEHSMHRLLVLEEQSA